MCKWFNKFIQKIKMYCYTFVQKYYMCVSKHVFLASVIKTK